MPAPKPASRGRTKVKTGCATCRIRKIKCDEAKPFCEKCVKTGRKCDGYESVFRAFSSTPQQIVKPDAAASRHDCAEGEPPLSTNDLNRYFSTKTIFDVELSCSEEAEQVLQASLTDDSIRHALLSLRALRGNLESKKEGDTFETEKQQRLSYNYGLQQYSKALTSLASSLASNLAYPSPDSLKSALLCCQVLISVEQVRGNFSAMGLHIIRGLNILHEYRARPYLTTDGLIPARHSGLPSLDVFIIKLFAAPCKFTEKQPPEPSSIMTPPVETNGRKLAPTMRAELTKVATIAISLIEKVTRTQSLEQAQPLLSERRDLLDGLDSWLDALGTLQKETRPGETESISDTFLRILYLILKIILLGTLESSSDLDAKLSEESKQLQGLANLVNERLKDYDIRRGIYSSLAKQSQ
ncbi:transcriptional regulatory protein moc3 [Fusarium bulbicola]|nr:transcriptional regulatory protein moc3 [Fusarium bulbicola]